jgi:hypothetical protein
MLADADSDSQYKTNAEPIKMLKDVVDMNGISDAPSPIRSKTANDKGNASTMGTHQGMAVRDG